MPLLHFKYYGTSCCVCPTVNYNLILALEVMELTFARVMSAVIYVSLRLFSLPNKNII